MPPSDRDSNVSAITSPFADLPTVVRAASARAKSGEKLLFYTNWSWDVQQVQVATSASDLISGAQLKAGDAIELGAWDTRIIVTS